jgi:hypothetical protein
MVLGGAPESDPSLEPPKVCISKPTAACLTRAELTHNARTPDTPLPDPNIRDRASRNEEPMRGL